MSDMIAETANRLFAAHEEASLAAHPAKAAEGAARWTPELWREIEELGFPLALARESEGGFGLAPLEALSLPRIAAAHCAPVPLAETMLANWLLTIAGLPAASGPATLASGVEITDNRLSGAAARTPYGRHAATTVVLGYGPGGKTLIARAGRARVAREGFNLAGEPRDDLDLDTAEAEVAPSPIGANALPALGATLRAQQLAGAMEATLDLTVSYAREREQFGRPIGKFQAIQQNLAVMAAQTAAARAAADMAADALPRALSAPEDFALIAGAAKLRASEAAGTVAAIAHQTHGAIGFTQEYQLHPLTRRLWAWRDEYGSEGVWAERLGARVAAAEADLFWPALTAMDEGEDAA
ncbi:acyl-CoA dehydrogenase [Pikeienuella piscinae]|uniref:Acyl-CoA dehydrogenase n=1 Tax=Pikeienuella piscinae TaxID=2748098 RepID=A0A7L5BTQ4_9RHOB|nr:acyl-CoA dehydrogenase [Pikeienuella piscinae]QIE55035.1 acyl-CoA dehydrogenase [Pikeienuella piscinae]